MKGGHTIRTAVGGGNEPENDGPHAIEDISESGVVQRWVAPDIFIQIEPMPLDDIFCQNA